jgi:hypothetical protein
MLLKLFRDTATCRAAAVAMSSGSRGSLIVAGGGCVRQPGTSLAVASRTLTGHLTGKARFLWRDGLTGRSR